jgi:phosphatidate cytidylyltransferase
MAGSEAMTGPSQGPLNSGGLMTRVVVGAFLAAVAIAEIVVGAWSFDLLVVTAVSLVFWEWAAMHGSPVAARVPALLLLAASGLLAALGSPRAALAVLLVGAIAFGLLGALGQLRAKRWLSTGILYAGLPAVALIWLRDGEDGFAIVMWAMAIVWATDIFAYFTGRAIGGPKLMPAVSPNKTWAGLLGGVTSAGVVSAGLGMAFGWTVPAWQLLAAGVGLGVVAQAGDLFESWLKRRAGVKDSGTLLPGHGGIMDRVDGLMPVVCLVALGVAFR